MVLGIDIGGTYIKFLVLEKGSILYRNKIRTGVSADEVVDGIFTEYERLQQSYRIRSVGIGFPGTVEQGLVTADNLPFRDYPLKKKLEERMHCKVSIENDANCAALGELHYGCGREFQNMVLLTLGTGIGGGIVIDGKLVRGTGLAGEFGHMVIQAEGGRDCPCGQRGCWEQYASAAALMRSAAQAADFYQESRLYALYEKNEKRMDGMCFFQALKEHCGVAERVFTEYIHYLCVGLENIRNILAPECIVLAGGITEERELILAWLKNELPSDIKVRISALGNDAGAMGAASL